MILFKRPEKPADFDMAVAEAKIEVQEAIMADPPKKPEFKNIWGDYKEIFSAAQQRRCGYCETTVMAGQDGDVEHYAPKSLVTQLGNSGVEHSGNRLSGRQFIRPEDEEERIGYWWLAYDWENYLLSCAHCNRKWKNSLFPTEEMLTNEATTPSPDQPFTPLLLNPFGLDDPKDHLYFGELGTINAYRDSPQGRETIRTCGLDRGMLSADRKVVVDTTQVNIATLDQYCRNETDEFILPIIPAGQAINDSEKLKLFPLLTPLSQLVSDGGVERPGYPGVVRCIFQQKTGITWNDLEDYTELLKNALLSLPPRA